MHLAAGAVGITVAKVGEAEVLPGDDVLIAYPLPASKISRLRELVKSRRVTVAVDSLDCARTLVEVDVGIGRCGVQTPEIRPGTYVFHDASRLENGVCGEGDCALRVLTTVVVPPGRMSLRAPGFRVRLQSPIFFIMLRREFSRAV